MATKNPRPGQPERFDRYGYEKMDYDRLMRESFHLKDSAEYAMSLGRKDPELRQKITALQQEFARRGFTAAATVLNAFLRKSFSRPGAKDTMASHKESFQKEYILWALPKGETDRLHERPIAEGITTPQQMDDAKRKAASQGWHGFRVQILDMNKPFRWMSRPGEKDTMAVEDRFYFGKGRKDRFADDAKQIADTILKQLGGGRFVAMTGAKNLAYRSSPPGLSMSIGRGAKNGIKYFRVDYDRAMDTYTLIFMNNSGGTVREIPFVHAGEMRRVFTMTTGFDTSL